MPCRDYEDDCRTQDRTEIKTLEEALCDARDLLVKLHDQQELNPKEHKRLANHFAQHANHRKSDRDARVREINDRLNKIKSTIGFHLKDADAMAKFGKEEAALEGELKRIKNLSDLDLLRDRFCDRVVL
jgi:hypothetical protein